MLVGLCMHLWRHHLLRQAFIIIHGILSSNSLFPTSYKYAVFTILLGLIHHILGRPARKASGLITTTKKVVFTVV